MGNVKVVEVDNETEEQSGGSDSEDLDYNRNDDEVFDDDGQVNEDVPVSKSDLLCHKACEIQSGIPIFTKHYALIREYAKELVNQNPGTTVRIDVQLEPNPASSTRTFKRVYVCLGAMKQGFKACGREFLGLDGFSMSGPFPGQLLTAVGIDANNGIYLVAYDVVDALNKATWCWFLKLLGEDLGIETNCKFTFISDRQKRLIQVVASVFPNAAHRFCVKHIHEEMKSHLKGGVYKDMLWKAARATTVVEFNKEMDHLKNNNAATYDWLLKIPAEQWSRSHFSGKALCGLLLNNICEVFCSQLNDVRDKSIIVCLEYIREYLVKRIVVVRQIIERSVGQLTPTVQAMVDRNKKEATDCVVEWIAASLYKVSVPNEDHCVANLDRKECGCRMWELTGIPCKHVVAAINYMNEDGKGVAVPEEWVHAAYSLETWARTYSFKINGCSSRRYWPRIESTTVIVPPNHRPQVDRPTKKMKSNDEHALATSSCVTH